MSVLSTGRGRWWVVLLALAWLAGCGNEAEPQAEAQGKSQEKLQDKPQAQVVVPDGPSTDGRTPPPKEPEQGKGVEATNPGVNPGGEGLAGGGSAVKKTPPAPKVAVPRDSGLPPVAFNAGDSGRAKKLNNEGLKFHRKGDYRGAMERFEAAVRADPGHILARYNLACATSLSGNGRRAVAILADLEASGCEQCVHQLGFARADKDFTAIWSDPAFLEVTSGGKMKEVSGAEAVIKDFEQACKSGNPAGMTKWWPASGKVQYVVRSSLVDDGEAPTSTPVAKIERVIRDIKRDVRGGDGVFHGIVNRKCKDRCCASRHGQFHHGGWYIDELCVHEDGKLARLILRAE